MSTLSIGLCNVLDISENKVISEEEHYKEDINFFLWNNMYCWITRKKAQEHVMKVNVVNFDFMLTIKLNPQNYMRH